MVQYIYIFITHVLETDISRIFIKQKENVTSFNRNMILYKKKRNANHPNKFITYFKDVTQSP